MKRTYIVLFFVILSYPLIAQDNWEASREGELEDSQVIIEKNRKLELPRIQRKFQKVPRLKPGNDSIPINYRWKELTPQLNTINPSLRVLRIKDDPLEKLYANQVSVGFGNYAASYVSANLANKRDKNKSYGLQLYHKHYNRGSVASQYSASGNQYINPYLRLLNKDYVLSASLLYDRFDNYAFGEFENALNANDQYERSAFQKLYQNISANVQLEDRKIENKIDYKLRLQANHFFSSYGAKESTVAYQLANAYTFNKKINFGMPIDGFFSQYTQQNEGEKANRYVVKFKPHLEYLLQDQILLKAGMNIVGENDQLAEMGKFHFYPLLEATYSPNSSLILKAGISGDVENQLFKDFAYLNPYIDQIDIINSVLVPFKFDIGLNANLFDRLNLTADYAIASVNNQHFFQNAINTNAFPDSFSTTVYYVEENLTRSVAKLGLAFSMNKVVSVDASAKHLAFRHDSITLFPNTPQLQYNFNTNFRIKDKLLIAVSGYGQTVTESYLIDDSAVLLSNDVREIDAFIDLGLSIKYNLTSRSTIFVNANNLIAKAYKNYINYPGRKFQLMAGFTYSF